MNHIDLDTITLHHGEHNSPDDGHCMLEVVAMFAHEPFSDHPACVSPVLAAWGRGWNDGMRSDDERGQLKRYIRQLPGTAGHPDIDVQASWMACDQLVRVQTPAWLRFAGLTEQAERLESLPELRSGMDVPSLMQPLNAVREDARAAWDASRADARDAAEAAARDAARAAARDAGRAAGWNAGRAAAWNDARADAGAAAWDDAEADAWNAAWDASRAASWNAARDADARVAARVAAWAALQPTVDELQESAHKTYASMIALYPRDRELAEVKS